MFVFHSTFNVRCSMFIFQNNLALMEVMGMPSSFPVIMAELHGESAPPLGSRP